jgi:hypothetical protein
MTTIKILNCIHQGRPNQNTTFTIYSRFAGDRPIENITEEWIMNNLNEIKPIDVQLQKNTSVKIIYQRK